MRLLTSGGCCLLDPELYGSYSGVMNKRTMKLAHKGSEEARNELPTLLEEAEGGRTTIITRRSRPVAALVPLTHAVQAASAIAINADALITHDRDFSRVQSLRVLP
jgi:prevent-host-death family protein